MAPRDPRAAAELPPLEQDRLLACARRNRRSVAERALSPPRQAAPRSHHAQPRTKLKRFLLAVASLAPCVAMASCQSGAPESAECAAPKPMTSHAPAENKRHVVVLAHGLLRSSRTFNTLEPRLREAGYEPQGFDYASTREDLDTQAVRSGDYSMPWRRSRRSSELTW